MTKEGGGEEEEEEARAPLSFDGNGHHSTNNTTVTATTTTTTGAKAINGHCRLSRLLLSHLQLWQRISDVVVVRVLVQVARDDLHQSAFRSYYVISRDCLSLASLVGWKKRQSTF